MSIQKESMRLGGDQAERVLAARGSVAKRRAAFRHKMGPASVLGAETFGLQPVVAGVRGVLVAEGDSWFDYPMHDVLKALEDHHFYEVESVAHKGDRVESMAYDDGQLDDFVRRIEKLVARNVKVTAILLSGGGNDIAGEEFGMLLNHSRSAQPGFNVKVVEGVLRDRIYPAFLTILAAVTRTCERMMHKKVPILIHGYDHPVPDGRGFLGGWGPLPGPWLSPGFEKKGYEDLGPRTTMMRGLIDQFNALLKEVAGAPSFEHVKYVDLRGTLKGTPYKEWWGNELHPTAKGFKAIAARIANAIEKI
jgi:lysophospholipase L1-like esterase